ncbi:hypothetical protein OH76DRAFT_1482997 [Lentinus brumalis]|uniref:Uncharacterized protein n=1 Tax=Lentinus brumalis TaxID=2498619 RepID=A0A371DAS7_9APHY|nr:hypothetical protein OH76DRAFT_1482997 [Polyporus brumalis]
MLSSMRPYSLHVRTPVLVELPPTTVRSLIYSHQMMVMLNFQFLIILTMIRTLLNLQLLYLQTLLLLLHLLHLLMRRPSLSRSDSNHLHQVLLLPRLVISDNVILLRVVTLFLLVALNGRTRMRVRIRTVNSMKLKQF